MAPRKPPQPFCDAVKEFEEASPWLGPQHAPAVVALRAMAEVLDSGDLQPALLGQFGLAFRSLAKERPAAVELDPLAAALQEAEVA